MLELSQFEFCWMPARRRMERTNWKLKETESLVFASQHSIDLPQTFQFGLVLNSWKYSNSQYSEQDLWAAFIVLLWPFWSGTDWSLSNIIICFIFHRKITAERLRMTWWWVNNDMIFIVRYEYSFNFLKFQLTFNRMFSISNIFYGKYITAIFKSLVLIGLFGLVSVL